MTITVQEIEYLLEKWGWTLTIAVFMAALLFAIIVYFLQRFFKSKNDKQLEKFKVDLSKDLDQFRIQFTKLNSLRCEGILELYKKLVIFFEANSFAISGLYFENGNNEEEKVANQKIEEIQRQEDAYKTFKDFYECFLSNKLLISKDLSDKIENLMKEIRSDQISHNICSRNINNPKIPDSLTEKYYNKIFKILGKFNNDVPAIIKDLETEFRQLIGVEN